MTLRQTNIGTTDAGRPLFNYTQDDPNTPVVLTGPSTGAVTTSDGTSYDVSPAVIEVAAEHIGEVAHLISVQFEENGHPDHEPESPYVHLCTESCGSLARPISDPFQALASVLATTQAAAVQDPAHAAEVAAALGVGGGGTPPASMALASATAENAALNGLDGTGSVNVIPDVGLNAASPGTTGANENANTGSYARAACSWNAASGGSKTNSSTLSYSTAGSVAVSHFSTWSSATYGAGTYAIGGALAAQVTAASITVPGGALTLAAA